LGRLCRHKCAVVIEVYVFVVVHVQARAVEGIEGARAGGWSGETVLENAEVSRVHIVVAVEIVRRVVTLIGLAGVAGSILVRVPLSGIVDRRAIVAGVAEAIVSRSSWPGFGRLMQLSALSGAPSKSRSGATWTTGVTITCPLSRSQNLAMATGRYI
jgi:hypothetical protein